MPLPPKKKFDAGEYVDGMFDDIPQEMFTPGSRVFLPPETIVGSPQALDNPYSRIYFPPDTITGKIAPEAIDPRLVVQEGVYDSTGVADVIPPNAPVRPAPPVPRSYARDTVNSIFADLPEDLGGPKRDAVAFQIEDDELADMPPIKDRLFPPSGPYQFPSMAERIFKPSGPSKMTGSSVASGKKPKR